MYRQSKRIDKKTQEEIRKFLTSNNTITSVSTSINCLW